MSEHDELNKSLLEADRNQRTLERAIKAVSEELGATCCGDPVDPLNRRDPEPQKYVQWTTSDGRVFCPAATTRPVLTPGVYEVNTSSALGLYFEMVPVKTEGLVRFPDTNSDRVVGEIQKFWEREARFAAYGLSYKRGILLYGPPGSGKSCTIQLIIQDVVARGGIVVKFDHPDRFVDGMRVLRQIQTATPVVVIMEDIDSIVEQWNDSEILNILDGVNDVSKTVFLATTNYPEKLGARIVNRPSRFDKRFRIGYPCAESRRLYFEYLFRGESPESLKLAPAGSAGSLLDQWVEDTDGLSVAHLKELFVAVVIIGDTYEEAIATIKSMKEYIEDKDYDSEIGFHVAKSQDFYG